MRYILNKKVLMVWESKKESEIWISTKIFTKTFITIITTMTTILIVSSLLCNFRMNLDYWILNYLVRFYQNWKICRDVKVNGWSILRIFNWNRKHLNLKCFRFILKIRCPMTLMLRWVRPRAGAPKWKTSYWTQK